MDDLDRRLVRELQADPRLHYSALGKRLGVTGMTAANRLQRLRGKGLVSLRVLPNLEACGLGTLVIGVVQTEASALQTCADVLRDSPRVMLVDHVTGEFDLSFVAAFPSEGAMGALVREIQSVPGVRRLVIHHRVESLKDGDGWSAVWAEGEPSADLEYEIAPGTRVPDHLRRGVDTAASWLIAFVKGDLEGLRELSEPDIVFEIMPPAEAAGTFAGRTAVEHQSTLAGHIYRHLWHRIVGVAEAAPPYSVLIDAINTAERAKGQVRTGFWRMAFGFVDGRVHRVLTLGQMELPDMPREPGAGQAAPASIQAGG